ncbi:histidine kinase [Cohnella endophytica]|nr:histidine kinase [Cohnella endophytica]
MKAKLWTIAIVFVALLGARLIWIYVDESPKPQAQAGVMDLSRWNPDNGDVVSLRGEWTFIPGKLIEPKPGEALREDEEAEYLKVPGSWDRAVAPDGTTTAYGYGTYKLKILLPPEIKREYALRLQTIRTSHKLFVDGKLAGQKGEPGTDRDSAKPRVMPYTVKFTPEGNGVELVVAVANFGYGHYGGIFEDIRFGSSEAIERSTQLRLLGNNLMMGFYLISGIYFLFLFLFRRRNKELLYFSLFFWMSLVFWSTHGERLLFWLCPSIGYVWQTRLQLFSSFGVFFSLFLVARSMFPDYDRRWVSRLISAISAITACIAITSDVTFFSKLEIPFMGAELVIFVYSFYVLFFGSLRNESGTTYSLIAAVCILMEGLVQGWHYLGYAPNAAIPPFERIVFIFAMALFIAKRFFSNMEQVEILSKRLLLADRLKNEFLANTSHEIRMPLHGMINLAQLMIDDGAQWEPRQQERLGLMVATGRRLAYLLNDILDLSKLNEGVVVLQPRAVDTRITINGVLEVMRYMTDSGKVNFENRTEPGVPPVLADEQRLMQILFQLLHYAVKSGADGVIAVQAEPAGDGERARIAIVAFCGDDTAVEAGSESELSLEISRKLIEMHGGELLVNEASFSRRIGLSFTLPLSADESPQILTGGLDSGIAETAASLSLSQTEAPVWRSGSPDAPRALIVDEDPVSLRIMANILEQEGLSVTAETDGLRGLKAWESGSDWELVVLDIMLPSMSGYDLCRHIRSKHSFYDLPVIFLTSRNQPADLLVGFNAGANDYVTEPIDASEFRARARTLLRMKQSIRDRLHMEMALFQAQIKPHFLFNTLNTIASLSETDPDRTRELLNDFASYLRGSFDLRNLDKLVPFSKEWTLVQSYLQIEQARFGNRIRVSIELPDYREFKLPPLSIQPIVENALRHGILQRFDGGQLFIGVDKEADGYRIRVRDDGVGFPPGKAEAALSGNSRAGIGLMNVHRRLIGAYGTGLTILSEQGIGTEVSFRIPIVKEGTV